MVAVSEDGANEEQRRIEMQDGGIIVSFNPLSRDGEHQSMGDMTSSS